MMGSRRGSRPSLKSPKNLKVSNVSNMMALFLLNGGLILQRPCSRLKVKTPKIHLWPHGKKALLYVGPFEAIFNSDLEWLIVKEL